jgi:quercetin dioxygenase-like cupin family protein
VSSRPPVSRTELLTASLDGKPTVERVQATRIELAPSQPVPLHLHPCPVLGCVVSGAIRFQPVGQPERILTAGDAFHEPANAEIAHFDNASDEEPAVFVAFYLLAPGETSVIEMLS